jgi:Molecular chaperone (small heat shock protein)
MAAVLRLSPSICVYQDENYENVIIEVALPGVEKKDISFKISDSGFYVRATKEGVKYADSYAFWCPVEPEKAGANYSNGLLKVTVPYKQTLEKLVNVKIE